MAWFINTSTRLLVAILLILIGSFRHDHFMYEGQVLYVLDAAGKVIERTMYKIKPRDIEEVGRKFLLVVSHSSCHFEKVHWASFGHLMQGRVREALEKIASREKKLTQETLQGGISSSRIPFPL